MEMASYRPRTVVSGGPLELAVLWGGFPLLGAGAGWLLAAATGWLARLPWVPFSDLIEWLDRLPEPQATAGTIGVGVLAGLVIAGIGTAERLIVTVDGAQVQLRRSDENRTIARVDTRVVFLADKHLVLLDADGAELVRESTDLPAAQLAAAFREHGWGWADDDPHRSAYRLWVPGLPGLPAGADALLRARDRAIERDRRDDARELRRELGQIGVVLRDEGKRQYWRLTTRALAPGPERPTSAEREPDGR
ncbi:YqeB family protein [Micromonospora sp. DT15]|uniref:YqeB family protein n=1 Tax=Micromonospora sp. DT15 TaxID=3393445 RepID=UPI003CE88470